MSDLDAAKSELRKAAFARRKAAHAAGDPAAGAARLLRVLERYRGASLAGYMPIRTEIDPRPAMAAMARSGPVGVPVIQGAGRPLAFHRWELGAAMVEGPFGAMVPAMAEPLVPEVLIVPLVAFDRQGGRLGYGGGYYDRTLAELRAARPTIAIGFAWAAQEVQRVPRNPTDEPLDGVVTETDVVTFTR